MEWEQVNGVEVMKGWAAKLAAAQRFYPALRLRWDGDSPCGDCACAPGQFHVPSCDMETCPSCKGQLIGGECEKGNALLTEWKQLAGH